MANLSNPLNPLSVSDMFSDPSDELRKQLLQRQKNIFAANQVGTPGRVSNMMGYLGNNFNVG